MAAMLGKVEGCQSVGNHTPMIGSGYDNFKKKIKKMDNLQNGLKKKREGHVEQWFVLL